MTIKGFMCDVKKSADSLSRKTLSSAVGFYLIIDRIFGNIQNKFKKVLNIRIKMCYNILQTMP